MAGLVKKFWFSLSPITPVIKYIALYVHQDQFFSSFLTDAQDSHLQKVMISEAAYIYSYDVDLLKMSGIMLKTCRRF
jgi:hypothetical protein